MPVKLPLILSGGSGVSGSNNQQSTILLAEESPRILKRLGPSNLIVDQVPDFINRDHQSFRAFIEAYYEWMEQDQNAFGVIDSFMDNADIDQSIGLFFGDFRAMYLRNFPSQLATDSAGNVVSEANFLKNVRNFYGAKGTEKAYRFLFRLIYNVYSEVKYPSKDILRCSSSDWIEKISLKTTNVGGTANFNMAGSQIYQLDENTNEVGASAIVTDVIQYQQNYYLINEIFIKNIFGSFVPNRRVYVDVGGILLSEMVYPVVSDIVITNPGNRYALSDRIVISSNENGVCLSLAINLLDSNGRIKGIDILDSGIGYDDSVSTTILSNAGDGKASLSVVLGAITAYAGYYGSNKGKLSSSGKLFDGDYYQDFSYVLRSEISFPAYKELYTKLIHPAGFKMFGDILLSRDIVGTLPFHSEMQRYENSYIGHYTPYRMGTTADLYNKYLNGFNPRGSTYSTYQSYGMSGGKLFVTPIGFTFNPTTTWTSIGATGYANNGISGSVFEFGIQEFNGTTYGVLILKGLDFNVSNVNSVTGAGFIPGSTFRMYSSGGGYTAMINMVRDGLGIVPEIGGSTHDPQGKPLGGSGSVEGYIEAQGFSYSYWGIHHHPNTRSIKGLTAVWNGISGPGASFGAVALNPFFRMPLGYHFHSNSIGTPYEGTSGSSNEYGFIESTTLVSPNI